MPLTNEVPLLTSQPEISWLKAVAPLNMTPCESRRSGSILLLIIGVVAIVLDKQKNRVRPLVWWRRWAWLWHRMHEQYSIPSRSAATTKTKHDYDTECMNNTASLQGQLQQQRQSAKLKRQKNEKTQESYSPIPLTKSIPLVTFQREISWLKAIAPSKKKPCESRRSGSILLLIIGVVAIVLDKQKKRVRPYVWWWRWAWLV